MGSEVHDRLHTSKHSVELIGIGDIADDELEAFGQELVPRGQVVVDDRFIASPPQLAGRVTPNVSGSSDYEHGTASLVHGRSILPDAIEHADTSRPEY